jgi:DNA-binding transcriptional LysR family regulator
MSTPASAPSEMAFFSLLARSGSFSAAARELDVTTPAVSKRLAQMEARLGVQLINRTTRRMSLTPEGETYLSMRGASWPRLTTWSSWSRAPGRAQGPAARERHAGLSGAATWRR